MECAMCCYISFVIILCYTQIASAAIPEYFVEEHCSQTLALNHGRIEAVKLRLTKAPKYPDGMRCAMRIQAPEGKRLIIRIENLDIYGTQETLCQGGDYMQFFDGPTESSIIHPELPATVCQKPRVEHISTSGRFFVMRFISNTDLMSGSGVKLTVTAFNEGPCSANEFRCKSTPHCIQRSLRCDKIASCPDATDERMPDCLSTAAIAGISVACVALVAAIVISVVVCCIVSERKKRARIIKRAMEHQVRHQVYAKSLWGSSQSDGIDEVKANALWGPSQHTDSNEIKANSFWGSSRHTHADITQPNSNSVWGTSQNLETDNSVFGTGKLDFSKIDPIWDGTLSYTELDWDKHLHICNPDPVLGDGKDLGSDTNSETKIIEDYDNCGEFDKLFKSEKRDLKMSTSTESQMKKVPSGFWEIDLSELGFDTTSSTHSSAV